MHSVHIHNCVRSIRMWTGSVYVYIRMWTGSVYVDVCGHIKFIDMRACTRYNNFQNLS